MTHRIWHAACALLLVVFAAADLSAQSADIRVTMTDSPDPVVAGTNLTYTITVTNAGPDDAFNASLTDMIPANTTFVSVAAQAGWTITSPAVGGTGSVTATRSTLAPARRQLFTWWSE